MNRIRVLHVRFVEVQCQVLFCAKIAHSTSWTMSNQLEHTDVLSGWWLVGVACRVGDPSAGSWVKIDMCRGCWGQAWPSNIMSEEHVTGTKRRSHQFGGNSRCPNPRKGDFQICFGGNGTCPNLRKTANPDLFGGKWNMSGFRQKCIARSVWGNWVSLDLRKSVFQDLFGGNLGLSGSQKKKIG